MNTAFVLGLALTLGLLLAASPAPAFDPSKQGASRTPVDAWARWPPRQHSQQFHGHEFDGHHFHGHRFHGQNVGIHKFHGGSSTLIVVPGAVIAPHTVWVPGQWAWTGFRWLWVPGHWQAR